MKIGELVFSIYVSVLISGEIDTLRDKRVPAKDFYLFRTLIRINVLLIMQQQHSSSRNTTTTHNNNNKQQ
jgi:hypothetical protein